MEPPLSQLVLLSFGLLFAIFADFVESQPSDTSPPPPSPFPPPPPPSPFPPPPPPSPPPSSFPPPPPPSPPPSSSPPPPPPVPSRPPPPSRTLPPPPPPFRRSMQPKHHKNTTNTHWRRSQPSLPPRSHHKLNTGEKIGLLFIGIVIILQIGVVGFLVFKRRQLSKVKGTYESCSSSS